MPVWSWERFKQSSAILTNLNFLQAGFFVGLLVKTDLKFLTHIRTKVIIRGHYIRYV
jgi:hypothetical protein